MSIYEVTQAQYKAVMGNNPSRHKGLVFGGSRPVDNVSWASAVEFCKKLSRKEGKRYRLPTEAEWEYACRAGTITRFHYGSDLAYSRLGEYAWYDDNSGEKTHKVGKKKPNPWGLYDMYGNISEWCQDWWDLTYYSESPSVDPPGPSSGEEHVYRGGAWLTGAYHCRSAMRFDETVNAWWRNHACGIRVVREVR